MITKAKIAIDASGLKQIHIAKQIGVEHTLLSMYLMGHRPMPMDVAKKLAIYLKVPIWNIVEEKIEHIK